MYAVTTKEFRQRHPGYNSQYYSKNRARIKATKNRFYALKGGRQWFLDNRERQSSLTIKRRQKDPKRYRQIMEDAAKRYRKKLAQVKKRLVEMFGGKCSRCPVSDFRVLDFDHINPKTKRFNLCIGSMHRPWAELVTEARKCQLLCANCHRIKTIENGDWANKRSQRVY